MVAAPFPAAPPPVVPDGVEPAFVRSVQRWSRAYPRRWRAARGDELLGLLVDLASPGARRLGVRSALDLVRGGWRTRLREHPPLWPWLQYRLLGDRSLRDHLGWVADDVAGALYPLREGLNARGGLFGWLVIVIPVTAPAVWAGDISSFIAWWYWIAVVVALSGVYLLPGGYGRRQAIETHLVARAGERVAVGSWVRVPVPRRRVLARAALPLAAAASLGTLAACAVAAVLAPRGAVLVALGVALAAGVALASAARIRLHRPGQAVGQPDRELEPVGARRAVLVVLGVALLAALPVAEALGVVPLALGPLLGIAAAVLAPPAVVAWLVVRQLPEAGELALVDVWRVGLVGRMPRVDGPATAVTPAQPSEAAVRSRPWSAGGQAPALG